MKLQEIIDFEINNILFEFKTKFNLEQFKLIENIEEKVEYAKKHLQFLGEGTSRTTFLLSNRFVLKIANPNSFLKGIAQNKSEVEIQNKIQDKEIITKIYEYARDYSWIIAELVRPIVNKTEFQKYTNISVELFKDIMYDITYSEILYNQQLNKNIIKNLEKIYKETSIEKYNFLLKNDFLQKTIFLIEQFNLNPADLGKFFHWGKTTDNRIVLLDYGYTEDMRKNTYL